MRVQTVLCPIDFSALSDRELRVAVEICETFDARLVLHHNISAASPGVARAWEWEKAHHAGELSEAEAERRLKTIMARLPAAVRTEAIVSRGPVGMVLLELADGLPADLMVLGCHGRSTDEHASTTERVIQDCPCPVLTLHDGRGEAHPFRLHVDGSAPRVRAVVPTDFSPAADEAVAYAFSLARAVPLELHLVHVAPGRTLYAVPAGRSAGAGSGRDAALAAAGRRLAEMVPAELTESVQTHLLSGVAVEQIVDLAERLDAAFIVMGEHARGLVRRFFTRDTSRHLLHRASCAVWFIPPAMAA
jgi:universal stress protein A